MLGETADGLDVQANRVFVKGQLGKSVEVADLFPISETNNGSGKYAVVANYTFQVPALPEDPDTGQSERIVAYYSYGALAVEVVVDTETGEVQIVRNGGCFDGGTPINPQMCEGQIEGGMVMGISAALYEQQIIGEKGEILNPNFHDYTIPTVMDVPDNQNMAALLAPTPHPDGPFGAKGIGEVSITAVPSAISNAIYNAIGVRIKDMPITSQKILEALNQKTGKPKNK